ncbi:MAG: hypothetical protein ACLFSR_03790 [Halomonas sp.]
MTDETRPPLPSPYHRRIRGAVLDVYDIQLAYRDAMRNPAVEHAVKKLLCPGLRGSKSRADDLREARRSIDRALEMEGQG